MKYASTVIVRMLFVALAALAMSLTGCQSYDSLIEKDEGANAKWADYEAQLQRRTDLIPNLVQTVKANGNYEQSVLTKITQARADATSIKLQGDDFSDPEKLKAFQAAQDKLSTGSLSRLLVSNENYPKLQATAGYADLMKQLEGTENRILRSREVYNEAVRQYNTELRKVRGSVTNKVTGRPFKERVFFTATEESKIAPKVSF